MVLSTEIRPNIRAAAIFRQFDQGATGFERRIGSYDIFDLGIAQQTPHSVRAQNEYVARLQRDGMFGNLWRDFRAGPEGRGQDVALGPGGVAVDAAQATGTRR